MNTSHIGHKKHAQEEMDRKREEKLNAEKEFNEKQGENKQLSEDQLAMKYKNVSDVIYFKA